jgi:hypothetical protein
MKHWQFELHQEVKMLLSEERGVIRGRAEYANSSDNYLVMYKNSAGAQVTDWWSGESIEAIPNEDEIPF